MNRFSEPGDFKQLITALQDPGLYDHRVAKVEVIETHISVVLLAGDYAYKIKKPVDFGFVDFTTLEKRKRFCQEELRLNRRFAPDLYLDVVAVRGTRRSPSLEGKGRPVEYAVKMRRFDQDTLLDRCIGRNGFITMPMIEAFAADVAAVHAEAAVAGPGDGYGSPRTITANVRECMAPIRLARLLDQGNDGPNLLEYMDERGAALEPWFERRLGAGQVRECHGDLHLGNLFVQDGRIVAFDCIEFNPALRWIDVANEIAFSTMDLRFHGKYAYARRFRNAYLDASGEYSMLRVLRYYEIYRVLVRAKVASLREAERAGTGLEDARDHFGLATRLMADAPRAVLIITHGLSGSGKTHLSGELVAGSDAIRIRSDIERDRRVNEGEQRYSVANVERIYRQLLEEAAEVVGAGYPVIVDATFLKRARRRLFQRLADQRGIPFRILYCKATEDELRRRVLNRTRAGTDASEADVRVLERQLDEVEPLTDSECALVVTYDNESPLSLNNLLRHLGLGASTNT